MFNPLRRGTVLLSAYDPTELLLENVRFFDGRTSFDIGGFSPTYRAAYRMEATGNCKLTLTGVGGEMYRNHFCQYGKRVRAEAFFRDCIWNPHFIKGCRDATLFENAKEYHIGKAEALLSTGLHGRVERLSLRRYYSEALMPEGQGHVLDAYNTISACVAPYLELSLIRKAYQGLSYIGYAGEYEGVIIRALDPQLAHMQSSYGFVFDGIPIKQRVKHALRAYLPGRLWSKLARVAKRADTAANDVAYMTRVRQKSNTLDNAMRELSNQFPELEINEIMKGRSITANIAYMSMTLYALKNCLS